METRYEILSEEELGTDRAEEILEAAGAIIKAGGLVAFPTETVYGLGADALQEEPCRKIYEAKGRPSDNPLIVHIGKWEDIYPITETVPEEAKKLADAFWPGPLTMILKKSDKVPMRTTGGLDTVAIRMPSHKVAREFILKSGGYIAAPSANRSGRPSPTLARFVREDMDGRIEMILDGGQVGIGLESTIVDLTEDKPMILRPGYITKEMLEKVLGSVEVDRTILDATSKQAPKAPGMKYRHSAPKAELTLIQGDEDKVVSFINDKIRKDHAEGKKVGVIATDRTGKRYLGDSVKCAGSRDKEETIARELFRILREFDDEDVDVIYSESFDDSGIGQAIMNRLLKAAGHHIEYIE